MHQTIHFRDNTRFAIDCFREFIFFNHFNIINFLQLLNDLRFTITEFEMSKSRRRLNRSQFSRLNQIRMFILNQVKFQQ